MKLLIATGLYPPDIGGPATYTVFLEKHLPTYGIEYCVVPFGIVRKFPKIIRHGMYILTLIKKGYSCDVLYALDTVSVGLPAMIASFVLRKPLYVRVPGDYAWEQGQQRYGITESLDEYLVSKNHSWKVTVLAWIQYRVAKYATRIIVPSEYMKSVVRAWGIDAEKVTRIYSALKVINVTESKDELRRELGYEGFVVSTAARLVPWKGIAALIEAVQLLRNEEFNISLEIIGDGSSRNELESMVIQTGMSEHVHFRGTVTRDVLGRYVTASDAFVLNTSYEGLSHQLLEVMHIGVPIITTGVGGNVELITHQKEGLLVAFNDVKAIADALKSLYQNETLRTSLVESAREKVAQFHEDKIISQIVSLFTPNAPTLVNVVK